MATNSRSERSAERYADRLKWSQLRMLRLIEAHDRLTMSEIMVLEGRCHSTTHSQLQRMVHWGILSREDKITDRGRCVPYSLTDFGREVLSLLRP